MSALLYISISIFVTYLTAITIFRGVPPSISESYYVLGENKLISSLFTWICWIVGGTLLPYWLDNGGGVLVFMACGGLMFVGTAPMFKSHEKTIHFASAVVCFVAAYLWLMLNSMTLFFISLAVLVIASFFKNRLFWWEVTAFVSIYTSLILIG